MRAGVHHPERSAEHVTEPVMEPGPGGVERPARQAGALERARTRDVTIKVFDQANHAFLQAVTGGRRESAALKGFVDGYLGTHVAWLSERL